MRVRKIIIRAKTLENDTDWHTNDMEPCHAPCFGKTRPIPNGWAWRSARAVDGSGREYVLYAKCLRDNREGRYNQNAVLMITSNAGVGHASVVARYEKHPGHGGIHAHFDCKTSGLTVGSVGLDNLKCIPKDKDGYHRRMKTLTNDAFWKQALTFFRIKSKDQHCDG